MPRYGSRVLESEVTGAFSTGSGDAVNDTGYATTKLGGGGTVGITLRGCTYWVMGDGVDISDCGSHGIEVIDSLVKVGAIAGSGNGGAGVYAHSGSVVHIEDGSPPTITGTVGDLSTDGTTEASTWADIDAGTSVADIAEMTMVKEV
jgi:hypothetical protein